MTRATVRAEVVYARADRQWVIPVTVTAPATVEAAIVASGVLAQCPEIARAPLAVGIYGRRARLTDAVHDGDRVEIYRPLQVDPKEARRHRAARKGVRKNSAR